MEPTTQYWELFNWLDVVIVVGLVASFLVGLGAGFYRQVAILGSLLVGLVVASQVTQPLAAAAFWGPVTQQFGADGAEAAAYGAIVFASFLLGVISTLIFRSFFGRSIRFFDSALGGVSGTAIGALVFGLTFLGVFHWNNTWLHSPIRDSYLGSRLAEGARVASKAFPDDFRQKVEAGLQQSAPADPELLEPAQPTPASFKEDTDAPPPRPKPAG